MILFANFLLAIARIVHLILMLYVWILIIRVVLSWIQVPSLSSFANVLYAITEPALRPVRRYVPPYKMGGLDISPMISQITHVVRPANVERDDLALLMATTFLTVFVQPRSKNPGVEDIGQRQYKVRVVSPPTKGEANNEVIEKLAAFLNLPKSRLQIVRGFRSRQKLIAIK